jgi:phosphoglycolate phosphatase
LDVTQRDPRDIGAILFDKDGTLFDFAATWEAWAARLLSKLSDGDRAKATALGDRIGYDFENTCFRQDSIAIAGTPGDLAQALLPAFPDLAHRHVFTLINDEAASVPMVEAVPLGPLLDQLIGHGLQLGIATNDAEAPTRAHLHGAGIATHFAFVAGSDSGHGAKPAPGQMHAFCETLGILPARCAMVGDSKHDLVAGRAAGMATVAVLTGMAKTEDLAVHADVVLPDIGHLPDWLGLG